jgi:hypothetical protein
MSGTTVGSSDLDARRDCIYQWYSLNDAISNDYPIVQLKTGNGGVGSPTVDYSVEVEVDIVYFTLWDASSTMGSQQLSAPFSLPDWYSECRMHGMCNVDHSRNARRPNSAGLSDSPQFQKALTLHPGDTPVIGAMQSAVSKQPTPALQAKASDKLAASIPAVTEGSSVLDDILGGIKKVVGTASEVIPVVSSIIGMF